MTARPAGPAPRCQYHFSPMHWQTSWGYPSWVCVLCMEDGSTEAVEGDALDEDTYFPGIPDYDRFGRPSWGDDDL